jgi:hypothetical protein
MKYYMVTLNGVPIRRWLDRHEADAVAERWQGSHGGYSGGSGLLKIKDRGDHLEVKEDAQANREFNERYKVAKAGERQVIQYEQRVESVSDADPSMR